MKALNRTTVVSIWTASLAVACSFACATGVIGPGTSPAAADEKAESLGVPAALKGFRGMLMGVIEKKSDREFIIKVEKITRTWKANKAENPQAAVGKQAVCELWKKGRLFEKQRRTLADLKAGDRVLVEPFHLEPDHDHLTVVEELRKVD